MLLALVSVKAAPDPRVMGRYRQMLFVNPSDGNLLDRLWKIAQENEATGQVLEEYKAASGTFAGAMVYGHLLVRAGRSDEAKVQFERAAGFDPKSALPHLALGRLFANQMNPKRAAPELEKALELLVPDDPQQTDILLQLGDTWLAANEPSKAVKAWERTCARDPSNLTLHERLAENYEKNGLNDQAITHRKAIEARGDPAQRAKALQDLARLYQANGNQDDAIMALDQALSLTTPGNWLRGELQGQLIRLHQRYHRTAELEARWKKIVEDNPRDLSGYVQMADLYAALGDPERQKAWLEKLTQLAPGDITFKTRLARVFLQLEQPGHAAEWFDQALKAQPGNADLVLARAEVDVRLDAPEAARKRVEALLKQAHNEEALTAKCLVFFAKHRLLESIEQHLKATLGVDEKSVLALADFYFAQHQKVEAIRTLDMLIDRRKDPDQQALGYSKIASRLNEQGEPQGAIEALRKAVELQPGVPEYHLALADIFLGQKRFEDARAEAEQAWRQSSGAARDAADQKLFQTFQTLATPDGPVPKTPLIDAQGRIDLMSIPVPPASGAPPRANPQLMEYIKKMAEKAADPPSEEAFLRVALWQFRSRNYKTALATVKRAIELNPASVPARELAVKIASADNQKRVAVSRLRELAEIDEARRPRYVRQIGQLQLELGESGDALKTLGDLVAANPGDVDALRDLAFAQQKADRWEEALQTWQRASGVCPPSRKKEILQPLLRVLERLNKNEQAAEVLLKLVDDQVGEAERLNTLHDLTDFCARHDLLDWLQTQYQQRHQSRPNDYFTAVALADILKATGHLREALALRAETLYSASDEVTALQEIERDAEELDDLEAAIKHQQRLLLFSPQGDAVGLEKLASLQERNFDIDEAVQTWNRIAKAFPRDPAVLSHATTFFQRWDLDDRAREILRKVRALDPANLEALTTLARLSVQCGADAEALSCFEQVLQNSSPEKAGDPWRLPVPKTTEPGKVQQSYYAALRLRRGRPDVETMRALKSFWNEGGGVPSDEREFRLSAIREMSLILKSRGGDPLRSWLARWENSGAPCEALWAFFYSDAHPQTLAQIESMMRRTPDDLRIKQAFIWLTLEMGEYSRLCDWLLEKCRTPAERDFLMVALNPILAASTLDPNLMRDLFAGRLNQRELLWQAAVLFASQNHLPEAAQLGERVFACPVSLRAAYGVELARWYVILGDMASARRVLRLVIREGADSLDRPACQGLRAYYFLLDESERAPFVESFAQSLDRGSKPLHTAMTLSLLHGLQGDEQTAEAELARLFDLRATLTRNADGSPNLSASKNWAFILATGQQLTAWRLDALARSWWKKALADPASIALQGDAASETAREIRMRLLASQLEHANPGESESLIEGMIKESPVDLVNALASLLASDGFNAQSIQVVQALWSRNPQEPQCLRNLLNACRSGGYFDPALTALREVVDSGLLAPNTARHHEVVLELVDMLERQNLLDEVQRRLDQALVGAPNNPGLLDRKAQLFEKQGRTVEALDLRRRLLSKDPDNIVFRIRLAAVLDVSGDTTTAIEILSCLKESARSVEMDIALAGLYLKTKDAGHARALIDKLSRKGEFTQVVPCADLLEKAGRKKEALRLLEGALLLCKDPQMCFQQQLALVRILSPKEDAVAFRAEFQRLEEMAGDAPELIDAILDFQTQSAVKPGQSVEKTLADAWRDGKGSLLAGERLVAHYLETQDNEKAVAVFAILVAAPDTTEPILMSLHEYCRQANRSDLAIQVSDVLCQRFPLNENVRLDRARDLHALGRHAEAVEELDKLGACFNFNEEVAGRLAPVYLEIGEEMMARKWFELAIRNDPAVKHCGVYSSYARILLSAGDFKSAKRVILTAFQNPANREVNSIVEALQNFIDSTQSQSDKVGAIQLLETIRKKTETERHHFHF